MVILCFVLFFIFETEKNIPLPFELESMSYFRLSYSSNSCWRHLPDKSLQSPCQMHRQAVFNRFVIYLSPFSSIVSWNYHFWLTRFWSHCCCCCVSPLGRRKHVRVYSMAWELLDERQRKREYIFPMKTIARTSSCIAPNQTSSNDSIQFHAVHAIIRTFQVKQYRFSFRWNLFFFGTHSFVPHFYPMKCFCRANIDVIHFYGVLFYRLSNW